MSDYIEPTYEEGVKKAEETLNLLTTFLNRAQLKYTVEMSDMKETVGWYIDIEGIHTKTDDNGFPDFTSETEDITIMIRDNGWVGVCHKDNDN